MQTDSPTVGGTLLTRELTNLPFVTTTTDGLFDLVPGMSKGEVNGNANPVIGGAPYMGSSNFTVNGISTSNPGQGGGGNVTYVGSDEMIAQANLPSIGTLQEFKVDASVVGAEYRSQVAVSMVTKQGSNQFHGCTRDTRPTAIVRDVDGDRDCGASVEPTRAVHYGVSERRRFVVDSDAAAVIAADVPDVVARGDEERDVRLRIVGDAEVAERHSECVSPGAAVRRRGRRIAVGSDCKTCRIGIDSCGPTSAAFTVTVALLVGFAAEEYRA